jgi:hypothetical protein
LILLDDYELTLQGTKQCRGVHCLLVEAASPFGLDFKCVAMLEFGCKASSQQPAGSLTAAGSL